ncbi:MAG: CRISPR-associated endonuclease Cas2, partial [Candidatus Dojkabacteria bacterium]|nr:CRISPR-associated endonuclease Cas2 [Candidatus Dojkabacteria bacterium]
MSKYMRILVLFDLPVVTKKQRKIYARFRKALIKDGYDMIQFSVYQRICNGLDMVDK